VARSREKADRRVVTARIADAGLELLRKLDDTVVRLHKAQLGHLDAKVQESLIKLLEQARATPA
jgi:DNA-binding MarR family transcriptional regulator